MVTRLETIGYETLDELNETYKPNNPDVIYLKKKYGSNISLSRAMYPQGHDPRYELRASKIIFNDRVVSYAE